MRHHLDHQAPGQSRRRVDEVAGEAHAPGPVDADQLRQADGQPRPGHGADPGVGVGEAGPLRCDEEVAVQGDLQPAGHRGAVDRTDHRRLVGRQEPEVGDGAALAILLILPALRGQRLEVHAGAERRVGPGQHHARDVVAGVEVADRLVELPGQLARDGVAHLGAVQSDGADPLRHIREYDRQRSSPASCRTGGADISCSRGAQAGAPRRRRSDRSPPTRRASRRSSLT